jgi:hypothetical protein
VVPDDVYEYCRPKSYLELALRLEVDGKMRSGYAQKLQAEPSLPPQENIDAIPYHYEVNFHNQLKARLLQHDALTQIIPGCYNMML